MTVAAIEDIRVRLARQADVQNLVIAGDFNESRKSLAGYREVVHEGFKYKRGPDSVPHKIDRVFTNMECVGFLEARASCENVHRGASLTDIGHKVGVLWVGAPPSTPADNFIKVPKLKKVRDIAKDNAPKLPCIDAAKPESDFEYTESLARKLSTAIEEIRLSSLTKVKVPRSNHLVLLDTVNKDFESKEDGNNSIKRSLYNFVEKVDEARSGTWGKGGITPRLEDLTSTLNKRFASLNKKIDSVSQKMLEKNFPLANLKGKFVSNKKDFKRLILSTSNSGACDYMKHSLKMTKTILGCNKAYRDFFQEISRRCFIGGFFPEVWREDQITFIFKCKGERSDPKSYRPITISPSMGKHLEKQIQFYLKPLIDANQDNHAYISGKSCTTAIVHIQKSLLNELNQKKSDRTLGAEGYRWITIFSLDDIEMAFESCENDLICKAVARSFRGDDYRVDSMIEFYFDRKTFTIDRKTGSRLQVNKIYKHKSTPQGSLLSTIFWRVYDGLFTTLYKTLLNRLKTSHELGCALEYSHGSYADDHFTPIMVKIKKNESKDKIVEIIMRVLTTVRLTIKCATEALGCGVNEKKSENIVPKFLHEAFEDFNDGLEDEDKFAVKSSFKWLGQWLILHDDGTMSFDLDKIRGRLIEISNKRDLLFQYTADIKLKFRIYKIYFAPFVEFYLPAVLQAGESSNTLVHRFQHDCLCKASGACYTVSRSGLEKVLNEPPVTAKAIRTALRLRKVSQTAKAQEKFEKDFASTSGKSSRTISLRSGSRSLSNLDTVPTFRKNLVMRINHFADLENEEQLFAKRKVCHNEVRKWVKQANNNAKKHALQAILGKRKRTEARLQAADDAIATPSLSLNPGDDMSGNSDEPAERRANRDNG